MNSLRLSYASLTGGRLSLISDVAQSDRGPYGEDDSLTVLSASRLGEVRVMLDLFYILIGVLFFVGCVAFVRACDRL